MNEWKANVIQDPSLFITGQVRVLVGRERQDGFEYLLPGGGSWIDSFENATPPDAPTVGFVVPAGALNALTEALVKHQGDSLPSAGEVRVLREWLAVERARVDAAYLAAYRSHT